MAQITVLDGNGDPRAIELPNANGRGAASASKPVVLSNEDLAAVQAISTALGNADFYPETQPVSAVSLPLPTGAATEAKQDALITAIGNLSPGGGSGGDASAAKQDEQTAVLESIETALGNPLAVTGEFFPATQPVSGTVGVSGPVAVTGTFYPATQPISATSLPLPTGAATQTTLAAIQTALGGALTVEFAAAQPVSVSGTVAVSAAALPLPAGAATAAKQDATTEAISALTGSEYETVAASQTNQVLGATGAVGDLLESLLVVPASLSPGAIQIKDGAGAAITVFTGGEDSISTLHPFSIPLHLVSRSGAWTITTGANASVVASGSFA